MNDIVNSTQLMASTTGPLLSIAPGGNAPFDDIVVWTVTD